MVMVLLEWTMATSMMDSGLMEQKMGEVYTFNQVLVPIIVDNGNKVREMDMVY